MAGLMKRRSPISGGAAAKVVDEIGSGFTILRVILME
jgi:hypothetical protein